MSRATMPQPGDVVAGKYVIERVLGTGGMGTVYEANHLRLRQKVALKMLLPEMLEHEVLVERFEREGQAAAKLKSRHAVRVLDVDVTPDGLPYLVMELLAGRDVGEELAARGKLPAPDAVDIVLQACAAMAEAHLNGIVHRDLKPSNLFFAHEGDERVVKVLDFGISKVLDAGASKLTSAESVMGTALYMSPEQVHDSAEVDARTDIWSLGVILFELLTGTTPWVGPAVQVAAAIVVADPPDLREAYGVNAELAAIVAKCLRKAPAERFSDVRQLASALADFAPPASLGRAAADALAKGSSPRFTIEPPSSSRHVVRVAEGATAPGWTQGGKPTPRTSPVLVAVVVAFVGGLVVIGLGFFAFLKLRAPDHVASTPTPPDSVSVAAKEPVHAASAARPDPAPSAAPSASASARELVQRPALRPAAPTKPTTPAAKSSTVPTGPAAPTADNPLTL